MRGEALHVAAGRLASTITVCALVAVAVGVLGVRAAGLRPLTVLSGSMQPAIDRGDLVLAQAAPITATGAGDVVTFADPSVPGRTVTHRIVLRHPLGSRMAVVTRGDANEKPERWLIARDGEVGLVRLTVPLAGYLLRPDAVTGRPLLIALVALLASGLALRRIWRPEGPS